MKETKSTKLSSFHTRIKFMKDFKKKHILIVDDNPFSRTLLKSLIESEGFSVTEARNGKEAIECLTDSAFQLIFTDLLMPGMDGFETIRRIRQMQVTTPIIISSSMSSREDRQRCFEAGGNDFLPKPVDIVKVKSLIKKYESELSESARFLPAVEMTGKSAETARKAEFSEYHILFVEEDDEKSGQYIHFLQNAGFPATRVSNGEQAWELFSEHRYRFRIIISNIFTSGIDGLGILARIKRDYPDVLVFIYAQERDPDTFQLAVQLGADGVLTQAEFEKTILELIEAAIYRITQKGSRIQTASTAIQVRKAQQEMIRYGCPEPCDCIDIAYSPLTDAGGDFACCRRFNLSGRCGILLGDVAGHNVTSSYISAVSLGILTSNWDKNQNPLKLLKIINAELNKTHYDRYHLCATSLLWDRRRQNIKIATAGMPGALLVNRVETHGCASLQPDFSDLKGGGMCLGLLKEDHLFESQEIKLENDTYLFLYSDGICRKHIAEELSQGNTDLRKGIRGVCREVLDRILEKHGQDDDMILIALKPPVSRFFTVPRRDRENAEATPCGCRPNAGATPCGCPSFKRKGESLHYEFLSDYGEADKACRWAAEQCIDRKLPAGNDPCFIFLALREALINAVKHGNQFDPEAFVDLSLFFAPDELRIYVSDAGSGFDISDSIKKMEEINVMRSGGRGLPVMHSLADILEVSGGTVSLIFREKVRG